MNNDKPMNSLWMLLTGAVSQVFIMAVGFAVLDGFEYTQYGWCFVMTVALFMSWHTIDLVKGGELCIAGQRTGLAFGEGWVLPPFPFGICSFKEWSRVRKEYKTGDKKPFVVPAYKTKLNGVTGQARMLFNTVMIVSFNNLILGAEEKDAESGVVSAVNSVIRSIVADCDGFKVAVDKENLAREVRGRLTPGHASFDKEAHKSLRSFGATLLAFTIDKIEFEDKKLQNALTGKLGEVAEREEQDLEREGLYTAVQRGIDMKLSPNAAAILAAASVGKDIGEIVESQRVIATNRGNNPSI